MEDRGMGSQHMHRPKSPHFFKVVSLPLNHGIRIPTLFMDKYGNGLKKTVVLKVPDGAAWRMELLKVNDQTWLQKGWQEFGEFYGVKEFHFLVFRYKGNSQFHVTIFGKTATEIDYPVKFHPGRLEDDTRKRSESEDYEDCYDDDGCSIELLYSECGKKRNKVRKTEKDGTVKSPKYVNGRRLRQKIKEESSEGTLTKKDDLRPIAFKSAHERAQTFKSENPFFISIMRQSYVSGSFNHNIPLAFAKEKFSKNCSADFELRIRKRTRKWKVRVVSHKQYHYAKFCGGWRQFVKANKLMVGDVCVFELVRGTKIFDVIIHRRP